MLQEAIPSPSGFPDSAGVEDRPLTRGLWIRNTAALVVDDAQTQRLIDVAKTINVTDVYLYVAPGWYNEKGADIAKFNAKVTAAGIKVWALDGKINYIDNLTTDEAYMDGLRDLMKFNELVEPNSRFHGFQADIQPQDTAQHSGWFQNDVPESMLEPEQHTKRDILMHIWLNALTRSSAFMHSYDMPFGAAVPWWLHDCGGEPVTLPWVSKTPEGMSERTCMMDLIMPLCDEYMVMSCVSDPAFAARRTLQQARHASVKEMEGHKMPRVLCSLDATKDAGICVPIGDPRNPPEKDARAAMLKHLAKMERTMQKYPAFSGIAIHDWCAWDELSS